MRNRALSRSGSSGISRSRQTGVALIKTDREVHSPRVGDFIHIPDIGLPVFREYMVEEFPVIGKVKRTVTSCRSPRRSATTNLHRAPRFLACSCAIRIAAGGAVDTRDIEPESGKIDRIVTGTAPEIDGPAGPDNPFLYSLTIASGGVSLFQGIFSSGRVW